MENDRTSMDPYEVQTVYANGLKNQLAEQKWKLTSEFQRMRKEMEARHAVELKRAQSGYLFDNFTHAKGNDK